MIFEGAALVGLLLLSAIFSGSETAFFTLRAAQLNACRQSRHWRDRWLVALYRDRASFLYTLLLGNLVVNLIYFACAASLMLTLAATYPHWIALAVNVGLYLILIVGCEVTPKCLGNALPLPLARALCVPLYLLHRALSPLTTLLRAVVRYCERALLPTPPPSETQENLQLLFEHYRAAGLVTHNEYNFINPVLALREIRVQEIMTPRVDLIAVNATATMEECLTAARTSGHSKLPVRGENERLIGWIDAREIFFAETPPKNLAEKLHNFIFLSEFSTAENALNAFFTTGIRLAVVVDERGGDAGILVLTDIIAEIFGEFGERGTPAQELIRRQTDGTYWFDCRVNTRTLKEIFGLRERLPNVATIGGLVTALLGRPAKVDDTVKLENYTITVTAVKHHRPVAVRINAELFANENLH